MSGTCPLFALQFHDLLTQRLRNVSQSLASLAGLVGHKERLCSQSEWEGLKHAIRSSCSSEPERFLFDAIICGATAEQALRLLTNHSMSAESVDMELF